nr:MAG TPA: hypothetical protein [Caudoviricetes sp.]
MKFLAIQLSKCLLLAHNRHSLQLWQKGMHTGWGKCERKEEYCAVCRRVYLHWLCKS